MFSRRVAVLGTSAGALEASKLATKRGAGFVAALGVMGLVASGCGHGKTSSPTGTGGTGGAGTGGAAGAQKLTILHTGDIHSHFMGYSPETDYSPATLNDDTTVGGMARLVTAINTARAQALAAGRPTLLLDAGDFTMGTLFELLETSQATELQMMQALQYDAVTIGNHELDWTPEGLYGIIGVAKGMKGVTVPILASNMKFSATDPGDDHLASLAALGFIQTKLVKTVGTLKVGFFGLLGSDAVTVTPQAAPLTFDPIAVAAAAMVTELRTVDKVDLVVALSHSGIDSTGHGEDAVLAAAVPGIDLIISGHTHDSLAQPFKVTNATGSTLIVAAGSYTQFLGQLQVTVTPAAAAGAQPSVTIDKYDLIPIDDTIAGDAPTQATVDAYIAGLDATIGAQQPGLAYKGVMASTTVDLPLPVKLEAPVGNLVTDAYRAIAGALEPTDPATIAVEANGQLRSPIAKGKTGQLWFADLFRVTPIGIGPDQVPGYPLVTFYLNAKDIASGLELGVADNVPDQYFLQLAGIKVTYDMAKPSFGRVAGLAIPSATPGGPDTALVLTDTSKCYKIVSTNYVAGLLGVVKTFTGGLLEVTAKDKDCVTPVNATIRYVDAGPTTAGVQELKHWQAVVKYVSMLPDANADHIPDMPAAYGAVQGRIIFK
jgi:5'-nucleotidase/UDP-sugar diphosphatase